MDNIERIKHMLVENDAAFEVIQQEKPILSYIFSVTERMQASSRQQAYRRFAKACSRYTKNWKPLSLFSLIEDVLQTSPILCRFEAVWHT